MHGHSCPNTCRNERYEVPTQRRLTPSISLARLEARRMRRAADLFAQGVQVRCSIGRELEVSHQTVPALAREVDGRREGGTETDRQLYPGRPPKVSCPTWPRWSGLWRRGPGRTAFPPSLWTLSRVA